MTLQEAAAKRTSRRKYLEKPLDAQSVRILNEKIAAINRDEGLHIQLVLDGAKPFAGFRRSYGLLTGVQSFLALAGNPASPHWRERLGYFGELLVLEAQRLGISSCWVGGSYRKEDAVCDLREGESLTCVIALGYCPEKPSPRERFLCGVIHRKSKSAQDMSRAEADAPQWFHSGVQAVCCAPSANNSQPVLFRYRAGTATADVPSGGHDIDLGIAKLHFLLGAEGTQGHWVWGQDGAFVLD